MQGIAELRLTLPAALLLLGGALLPSHAQAAPRGSVTATQKVVAKSPAASTADFARYDAWLRRLTGSFRINSGTYERKVDCRHVGEGPGVHCLIGPPPVAIDPDPAVVMYGMAADIPGIRYLQVNGKGIAEGAEGKLSDATVTFPKVSCLRFVNQQARVSTMTCDRMMRIHAPAHGDYFMVSYYTEMLIVLPTPPSGRRPPGQIATERVNFHQHTYFERERDEEQPD